MTRCLAFCQLTNPLTWPEHVLLTLRQPNPTNCSPWAFPEAGADEAEEGPARGLGSLCRPILQGRAR